MPTVSTAFAKNVIRRAFSHLVDPTPDRTGIEKIWQYFAGRCAYCDRSLTKGLKEAHIDHLVSASLGGQNHIANRVLSCATCNEKEKRDSDWEVFLESKAPSAEEFARRAEKIRYWQNLHARELTATDTELLNAAEAAAAEVTALFNEKVGVIKALRHELRPGRRSMQRSTDTEETLEVSNSRGPAESSLPAPKVRYAFSRLCFKADIIEPLAAEDHFRVDTPDGSFQMSKDEFQKHFANVLDSRSYRDAGIYHYPVPPQHALPFLVKSFDTNFNLDDIVRKLDQHHQRATYGAVSSLVGVIARSVMQNSPKDPIHSWVVSKSTGLPTGSADQDVHPAIHEKPHIIGTGTELAEWMGNAQ